MCDLQGGAIRCDRCRYCRRRAAVRERVHARECEPSAKEGLPRRPVRIMSRSPPGAGDMIARLMRRSCGRTGSQFLVENQGGAGGHIGMGWVDRASADGYTIMIAKLKLMIQYELVRQGPFDPIRTSIRHIAATTPSAWWSTPRCAASNVTECRGLYAPENIANYAHAGAGTPSIS